MYKSLEIMRISNISNIWKDLVIAVANEKGDTNIE